MGRAKTPSSILHVHTVPVISGSGINTLLTMRGSLQRGHRVALACESAGGLTLQAAQAGVDVHLIPSMGREIAPAKDIESVFELAQLMHRHRFDMVHTHNSKAGFVGRLAARIARVPLIIHTVHGFAFHDAEPFARRTVYRTFERTAAHWCDGMIFISKALEQWAGREGIGLNVPHRVVYSGIDVDAFRTASGKEVRRQFGIPADRLVVGIISKLWEGKGHRVLLHAWREIQSQWLGPDPPVLLVVGEGALQASLQQLASQLDISSTVIFAGFRANIPEITAALDISVLPSAFEGMGRVVLEAMAAAKAVVASRVGGIPDLVQDGVTGLLVPPNEVRPLAGAIERLLKNDALRHAMDRAASAALESRHSASAMVEEIHRFYEYVAEVK